MNLIDKKINFEELEVPIPEIVFTMSVNEQEEIFNYIKQFNNIEKKAYNIAFEHLKSSFNISKSIGFKEWKSKNFLS